MKKGIYMTSKTRHAQRWLEYKSRGWPIISSWLTNIVDRSSGELESLWETALQECNSCRVLVAYVEPGERLYGGIGEIGAALGGGAEVFLVGEFSEIGTMFKHRRIRKFNDIHAAMLAARERVENEE